MTTRSTARFADIGRLRVGDRASLSERVDDRLVRETARVTGDDNPIHLDPAVALEFGQSRPVAHGVILIGLVSRMIGTTLPGPGSVWFSSELEFLAPVYPGDDVTVELEVVHVSIATRVVALQVLGRKSGEIDVLRGKVRVRVPDQMPRESPLMSQQNVVIVTGGSRGVGRAIAEALAPAGQLVLGYRANEGAARSAADAVKEAGGDAVAVAADLSAPEGAGALVEAAMRAYGRVDAIVHAATPPVVHRDCLETTASEMRAFFDTYVVGLHELVRLALPGMKERRHGRIVALLSSAITEVPPKLSAYVAAKHALLGFCRALAVECGPFNVGVNTVSPSMVIGEYADSLGAAGREAMVRKTPMRRLATSDDVARCVKFLLSPDAAFINGANVPVTGGIFV